MVVVEQSTTSSYLKKETTMKAIVFLACVALAQSEDYNPYFPDAAPDSPWAIKGTKEKPSSHHSPTPHEAHPAAPLKEKVRYHQPFQPFRSLTKGEIVQFLTKIFYFLGEKCITLNAEKLAEIQVLLQMVPSGGSGQSGDGVNSQFQKLLASIDRCTHAGPSVNIPGLGPHHDSAPAQLQRSSTKAQPRNTSNASGAAAESLGRRKLEMSFSVHKFDWDSDHDLFGSAEETNDGLTTEPPRDSLKYKLKALKKPIVNWMNSTWFKVKEFFTKVYQQIKQKSNPQALQSDSESIDPEVAVQRQRRQLTAENLLQEAWSPTGHPSHIRQVLKMILNEIFRIYGHSCPDALTNVPAFKNAARSTVRMIMQSADFIQSGAAKILDSEFVSELIECGELEVVPLKESKRVPRSDQQEPVAKKLPGA